jgi:xylulokinase
MYNLGLDIGTSFIKAAITEISTGEPIDLVSEPSNEQSITSLKDGWAEQNPEHWWKNCCKAIKLLLSRNNISSNLIKGIGVSYQMHGLVLIDSKGKCLKNSIIWCDDRAIEIGKKSFYDLGEQYCTENLLNSPANFTASKLKWVKDNEPHIYSKIYKIMLPGDYIVYKLTNRTTTTKSGLSEGIFWDFKTNSISKKLLDYFGINSSIIPEIVPTFGFQCSVDKKGSIDTGLNFGTPINYRAGDQSNNALSLNVLKSGQIAATAGTSGVIYAVSSNLKTNETERINNFIHLSQFNNKLIGKLLCINGAGIQYAKLKRELNIDSYEKMNKISMDSPVGSNNLVYLPFGNGSERMLNNKNIGSLFINTHINNSEDCFKTRSTLEGIAFAFVYGMKILIKDGVIPVNIKAGNDNLFRSSVFGETISTLLDLDIEIYNTTGAIGAARAVDLHLGDFDKYGNNVIKNDFFKIYKPQKNKNDYIKAYDSWLKELKNKM